MDGVNCSIGDILNKLSQIFNHILTLRRSFSYTFHGQSIPLMLKCEQKKEKGSDFLAPKYFSLYLNVNEKINFSQPKRIVSSWCWKYYPLSKWLCRILIGKTCSQFRHVTYSMTLVNRQCTAPWPQCSRTIVCFVSFSLLTSPNTSFLLMSYN